MKKCAKRSIGSGSSGSVRSNWHGLDREETGVFSGIGLPGGMWSERHVPCREFKLGVSGERKPIKIVD